MKLHRVFVAINLPDEVKGELLAYKDTWPELSARWTTPENLHITLVFLGNTSDQELAEVCELLRQVGERHTPFEIHINRIAYGPDERHPRVIWAQVETSTVLLALQQNVEKTLGQHDSKPFSPHVTLARLKPFQLARLEPEEMPQMDEEISFSFPINSIEVMESELKRSGAQYTICQSVPLTGN